MTSPLNSGFRATGKGYANQHGHIDASELNGNALIENLSPQIPDTDQDRKRWLRVTGMSSAWQLQGSSAQAQGSKSFYPQNLTQSDLIVQGQCSSQYEYDQLVQFVSRHQRTAQNTQDIYAIERSGDAAHAGHPVEFQIIPLSNRYIHGAHRVGGRLTDFTVGSTKTNTTPKVHVQGYITSIAAGAERFKFQPRFQITIKVTNDLLQNPIEASTIDGVLFDTYLSSLAGPGGWKTTAQIDEEAVTGEDGNAITWTDLAKGTANIVEAAWDWASDAFDEVTLDAIQNLSGLGVGDFGTFDPLDVLDGDN